MTYRPATLNENIRGKYTATMYNGSDYIMIHDPASHGASPNITFNAVTLLADDEIPRPNCPLRGDVQQTSLSV